MQLAIKNSSKYRDILLLSSFKSCILIYRNRIKSLTFIIFSLFSHCIQLYYYVRNTEYTNIIPFYDFVCTINSRATIILRIQTTIIIMTTVAIHFNLIQFTLMQKWFFSRHIICSQVSCHVYIWPQIYLDFTCPPSSAFIRPR